MKASLTFSAFLIGGIMGVLAGPLERTSANYRISSEAFTSGGVQDGSANYTVDSSTDDQPTGVSTSTGGGPGLYTDRAGHIGQLVDPVLFWATNPAPQVPEEASIQLNGVVIFDDGTLLSPAAPHLLWSIVGGPVESVTSGGLATAGAVLENSLATVSARFDTFLRSYHVTVLEVDPDNFGLYGGDGIDDGWQAGFFGTGPTGGGSPDGLASSDPDGDGQDNAFEWLSGFAPDDSKEFLLFAISEIGGGTADLEFSKVIPGTRYSILKSGDLSLWTEIGEIVPPTVEFGRVFQDRDATEGKNFYRAKLEKIEP